MRGMILGTKNVVDDLVPQSNKLIQQSLLHDRAITGLKSEVEVKTSSILEELEKVNQLNSKQRVF